MMTRKVTAQLLILAVSLTAWRQHVVADEIRHFSDGPFSSISDALESAGIDEQTVEEVVAQYFTVSGVSSETVELEFRLVEESGAFRYSFGFFHMSGVTAHPIDEKAIWASQALSDATNIFNDGDARERGGDTRIVEVRGGSQIGFYLIPDNTLESFNSSPGEFYPPIYPPNLISPRRNYHAPHFSVTAANPLEFDQMLSFVSEDQTLLAFEDLAGEGFQFFDVAVTIDSALLVPEPAGLISLSTASLLVALILMRRSSPFSQDIN